MPLYAPKPKDHQFKLPAPGLHEACCYALFDIGTQYSERYDTEAHKILICWELKDETVQVDGKDMPMAISRTFTFSLHPKATLRSFLKQWRGKDFSENEIATFDFHKLIGQSCYVNVVHYEGMRGDTRAKVEGAAVLRNKKLELVNDPQYFSLQDGTDIPENCPTWIRGLIEQSAEWKERVGATAHSEEDTIYNREPEADTQGEVEKEDDMPF